LHRAETVVLENSVPQSSSTTARTFLVDTLKRRPSRLLSQQERLLAPLVPLKKLRGEVPASQPRNHKRKFSYARLEHFIPVPVAVPLAFFGAFVGLALSCSGTKHRVFGSLCPPPTGPSHHPGQAICAVREQR
jgi:hypothetical protein